METLIEKATTSSLPEAFDSPGTLPFAQGTWSGTAIAVPGDGLSLAGSGSLLLFRSKPEAAQAPDAVALLLVAAGAGSYEEAPAGRLAFSEGAAYILGLSRGQKNLSTEAYLNLIHGDDRKQYLANWASTPAGRACVVFRYRVIRPDDGRTVWVEDRGARLGSMGGSRRVGLLWDVTLRAEAEEQSHLVNEQFRLLVGNVREYALFLADTNGCIAAWNPGAEHIFGYSRAEALGMDLGVLLVEDDPEPQLMQQEVERARTGEPQEAARWLRRKDGSRFWASWSTETVKDLHGAFLGVAKVLRDETERMQNEAALHQSLAEKEELLREVHHRVKNNLQVISSMLNLQSRQIEDPLTRAEFDLARNRIQSVASIHELLYQVGSLEAVDLKGYAGRVTDAVVQLYNLRRRVSVEVVGSALELKRAVPFGLLLNELVSNSCKHAFPPGRTGQIAISIDVTAGNILAVVSDTGVGFSPEQVPANPRSLGMFLMERLARQLEATLTFVSGQGTRAEIRLPREAAQ